MSMLSERFFYIVIAEQLSASIGINKYKRKVIS